MVFRVSLKFLPLLPREEFVSRSDGRRGAGRQSFLGRCFGWCVSSAAFPCNSCIIKADRGHPSWVAAWRKRRACSSAQLCAAHASLTTFLGALVSSGMTACSRSLDIPQLLWNLLHATSQFIRRVNAFGQLVVQKKSDSFPGVQQATNYTLKRNIHYLLQLHKPGCLVVLHKSSTPALKTFYYLYILVLRKLPCLTILEPLWQSHSQCQTCTDFRAAAPVPQLTPTVGCSAPNAPPTVRQVTLLVPPQVSPERVSDLPFHKAIYSLLSYRETFHAGASEEGPSKKGTLTVYPGASVAPLQSLLPYSPLLIHLAGITRLHLFCYPKCLRLLASAVSLRVHSPWLISSLCALC